MNQDLPHDISVNEVRQLLDDDAEHLLLLDCRNQDEYDLVRLQTAQLIPMQELPERIGELEPYRESRIVVYCHSGGRSQMVADWLRWQDFKRVQNMTGGIDAWATEIDPSLPRY